MMRNAFAAVVGLFFLSSCYYDPSVATPGAVPPAGGVNQGVASSVPSGNEIQEFMDIHNQARAEVGLAPLQWSGELASYAGDWANQLASEGGSMRHRDANSYGESIYISTGNAGPGAAARSWYSEKRYYNGGPVTQGNLMQIGHYTQMVSRNTTQVGFGMARFGNGVVIVANYSPPGNWLNQAPY